MPKQKPASTVGHQDDMGTARQWGVMLPYLSGRDMGNRPKLGDQSRMWRTIYSSMSRYADWDPVSTDNVHHGSIYNLGYSTDGTALVGACERRSILLFDPNNHRLVGCNSNAHKNGVNCVKFLDTRTFVTCSDDSTVALWDCRNLGSKVRSLEGHDAWVKNIEYCSSSGLLLTSGFDGNVLAWDINDYSEKKRGYQKVCHMHHLMRSQLTPDHSQLILSSSYGYMLVINKLDIPNLWKDLKSTPQQRQTADAEPQERERNRLRLITDFPMESNVPDNLPVVSSLTVHPQGWCVLSRSTSRDDRTEWTCIHDIQPRDMVEKEEEDNADATSSPRPFVPQPLPQPWRFPRPVRVRVRAPGTPPADVSEQPLHRRQEVQPLRGRLGDSGSPAADAPEQSRQRHREGQSIRGRLRDSGGPAQTVRTPVLMSALYSYSPRGLNAGPALSSSSIIFPFSQHLFPSYSIGRSSSSRQTQSASGEPRTQSAPLAAGGEGEPREGLVFRDSSGSQRAREALARLVQWENREEDSSSDDEDSVEEASGDRDSEDSEVDFMRMQILMSDNMVDRRTHSNPLLKVIPSLPRPPCRLFQIPELNVGRGYIKEQCFSPDGRIICSPYDHGVRILSFNPECQELSDCVPSSLTDLHTLATVQCHVRSVLTTAFSPTSSQFVSGCLGGKIVFHQPIF